MVYLFTRSDIQTVLHFFYDDNTIYRIEEGDYVCYWKHEIHSDIHRCVNDLSYTIPEELSLYNIKDLSEQELFNLIDNLILNNILNSI